MKTSPVSILSLCSLFVTLAALLKTCYAKRAIVSHGDSFQNLLRELQSETLQDERRLKHYQKYNRKYSYLDAEAIYIALNSLARTYPELATLKNAQEMYGLPAAGNPEDCSFDTQKGCLNWILTIEDKIAHPDGSESGRRLPEVALLGALHGNERVGPTVVVETAALMLDAAFCEARPRGVEPLPDSDPTEWKTWEEELIKARECRRELRDRGINADDRKWLARLVSTRRIVVVPAPNALGYYREERNEDGIATKTDYPFDISDNTKCMQTIAGRTINELFREHMFQLVVSFHAGTRVIAHEWASPTYKDKSSPDDEAQDQIATGLAMFAGKFDRQDEYYPTGSMIDLMLPNRGRLEDWAYASTWVEPNLAPKCNPITYGGYPVDKTTYNDSMLRAVTMMVETSESKKPPKSRLGSDRDLFNPASRSSGHVARNLRLSLMMIDIVEPYVDITAINGIKLQDNVVPLRPTISRSCMTTKAFSIPTQKDSVKIEWYVGGAMSVGSTSVMYAKWSDLPNNFDGVSQPTKEVADALVGEVDGDLNGDLRVVPGGRGKSRWYKADLDHSQIVGPFFSASIDISDFEEGDVVAVFAVAQVDKSWEKKPLDVSHDLSPQSHIVNARRNPDWHHENAGKIIEGRMHWFSVPVTLNIGAPQSVTEEISMRLAPDSGLTELEKEAIDISAVFICLFSILILIGALVFKTKREHSKKTYSHILAESERHFSDDLELTEEEFEEHTID